MELLIVTGMSGAGKSQAANVLEDMGYYCVDNVPPSIIPSFVDLAAKGEDSLQKIAIVTDSRAGNNFSEISAVLDDLAVKNIAYKILFLDADNEVIVRRYKENRRKHPLTGQDGSIEKAVESDRSMLLKIRDKADFIIDTSFISISQLKEELFGIFVGGVENALKIQCRSFGFKYGTDREADLVFDARCLPNPFYISELKEKTGLDADVRDYVLSSAESKEFTKKLFDFIDTAVPLYAKEGKSSLTIAVGCTGGKHRSVTISELLSKHLISKGYNCIVIHRDIQKR